MTKVVLDDFLVASEEMEIKPGWQQWVAIVIMWIGVASFFTHGFYVNVYVYAGIGLLTVGTIINYKNFRLGVYATLIVIFISFIGLARFFPIVYTLGLSFNDFEIGFYGIPFLLGILHGFLNRSTFSEFIGGESSEEEKSTDFRRSVEGFKRGFGRKDLQELESIADNEILLPEAKLAARELIAGLVKPKE